MMTGRRCWIEESLKSDQGVEDKRSSPNIPSVLLEWGNRRKLVAREAQHLQFS